MAKLVTVVQTYFSDGTYRNNRVEMQIPNEAAEIIKKYWLEKHIHKCTKAKYLALNQAATVDLFDDEDNLLCGMHNITAIEQDLEETFEHSFANDKDDRD